MVHHGEMLTDFPCFSKFNQLGPSLQ